jgi:hypothetical protein
MSRDQILVFLNNLVLILYYKIFKYKSLFYKIEKWWQRRKQLSLQRREKKRQKNNRSLIKDY